MLLLCLLLTKYHYFKTTFSLIVFMLMLLRTECPRQTHFPGFRISLFPLQANLALSPTALLPASKNSEVKLQPAPLAPTTSCGPPSPTLQPPSFSTEEEEPAVFDTPPVATPLPSINKVKALMQRCTLASEAPKQTDEFISVCSCQ